MTPVSEPGIHDSGYSIGQAGYSCSQSLHFGSLEDAGFDVELEANVRGLELRCGGMHTPLAGGSDPDEAVRDALGLVRDLLSPGMRLTEQWAGGSAYHCSLEAVCNGGWQPEYEMALIVWNFFGRRSERIYQNGHLPVRDPQDGSR
jgi:hypothetical protein